MDEVLTHTRGTLSFSGCRVLARYAASIPNGGAILDINCGTGRSTVVMALALRQNRRATILATDSHVTDPLADDPFQHGSVMIFLETLRRFKVSSQVIPVVSPVHMLDRVIGKRSANLVVIQSPATIPASFNEDVVVNSIRVAKDAVRSGGSILVCCPDPAYIPRFNQILDRSGRGLNCAQDMLVGVQCDV